jgi:broad specificity phosphatase PhoE
LTWLSQQKSYVSPRRRAQRTLELLNLAFDHGLPWTPHGVITTTGKGNGLPCTAEIEVTEDIREWDYGEYEGITTPEIRKLRASQGLDPNWDIWRDGCPGGEYVDIYLLILPNTEISVGSWAF